MCVYTWFLRVLNASFYYWLLGFYLEHLLGGFVFFFNGKQVVKNRSTSFSDLVFTMENV